MSLVNENQALIDATRQGAQPVALDLGKYWIINGHEGVEQIDLTGDEFRDFPRRIKRHTTLTDVASFLDYWTKFAEDGSEAYTARGNRQYNVTAIFDAHAGPNSDFPVDWCQHRAVLALELSQPLQAWLNYDRKLRTQEDFSEFVEEMVPFIVDPPAADLKELAETFQATTTVAFQAGVRIRDGQRTLSYRETNDATVKDGAIAVPDLITLALPIWRGSTETVQFTARIRYRINSGGPGKLAIMYVLDRPQDIIDLAFDQAVGQVGEHIGRPVFHGTTS